MGSAIAEKFDVAIAGAGPAGSSLAIRLALSGVRVFLAERSTFPRNKLCGEFISPECLAHFDELGVSNAVENAGGSRLTRTIFYATNGRSVTVNSNWFGERADTALGLSRAVFDQILLERAKLLGVTVRTAAALPHVTNDGQTVEGLDLTGSDGSKYSVKATVTVDATGRARILARKFDHRNGNEPQAKHVAFKTHLENARIENGNCEIYVYPGGYGGCSPINDRLFDLCFIAPVTKVKELGSDADQVMRSVVCKNERARKVLEGVNSSDKWLAVPITPFGRRSLAPANGLLTIGDAAAFIDPFTGSGILLALESAKLAARAICQALSMGCDFSSLSAQYDLVYGRTFDRRLRTSSVLRHAATVGPLLADPLISILSKSDTVLRWLARGTRLKHKQPEIV